MRATTKRSSKPIEPQVEAPTVVKHESILESFDTKTADELLSRNLFVSDEDMYHVIDYADDDAWNYIYTNRHKYAKRIREVIEPNDYKVPIENLVTKIRELSDKEWDTLKLNKERKLEAQFEKDWTEYSDCISDRPLGEVDSRLDDAWEKFTHTKDKLTKYIASRSKTYLAPSLRGKEIADPKQVKIEDEIREMENEYDKAQKLVEDTDSAYWETKKNEYRKTWMPKLSS